MEKDVEFLRSFGIMDYSLLFAIEQNPKYRGTQKSRTSVEEEELDLDLDELEKEDFAEMRHKFRSTDGKYFYHLGIIDYLQEFNLEKRGENFLKTLINKADA